MKAKRKDNRQINFRVSENEFERLEQMAKEFQMSVPAFCKMQAQDSQMEPPKINREGAIEMIGQLRRIGNNVNQLSRRANEGGSIGDHELKLIRKELNDLSQQFKEAIQKQPTS